MTVYGADYYGQDPNGNFVYYGIAYPLIPAPQTVAPLITVPLTAQSVDYNHILVQWEQPVNTNWLDFRLLSNRYGYPVDENDGTVLLDSNGTTWPGSSYLDANIIPGTYHHYGIYMLLGPGGNQAGVGGVQTGGNQPPPNLITIANDTFQDGYFQSLASSTQGSALLTPNIPVGSPYAYGFAFSTNTTNDTGPPYFAFPNTNPFPIQQSTTYTVTAWVNSPTSQVFLGMNFLNAGGTLVSQSALNLQTVPPHTWIQVSQQITVPATSTIASGSVVVTGSEAASFPVYTMYVTGMTVQLGIVSTQQQTQAQNTWVRAGLTATLAPSNFSTTTFLLDSIPTYFKELNDVELTTDASGNTFFEQYLSVIAWSIDYLKTALVVAQNVNNPNLIPINDLFDLAQTIGFPFEPEISAGIIRNGIANVAQLVQQRGTPEGIAAYVTNLTGFALDLVAGYNLMLDDNQSEFTYPTTVGGTSSIRKSQQPGLVPTEIWSSTQIYQSGDIVNYGVYKYISNINNNLNEAPTGLNSNNTQWNVFYYTSASSYILNPLTDWPGTYEPRWAVSINEFPNDLTALSEAIGILDPLITGSYQHNGLKIKNNSGQTSTIDLRSVSRLPSDIANVLAQPDTSQVVGDGIPIPYTIPQQVWNSTTEYLTGEIVQYQGLPFIALKASTNIPPPSTYTPSNEWQALGYDSRIQMMTSAYTSADFSNNPTAFAVTPYVSFYDQYGVHISDLIPRDNGSDEANLFLFDSFAKPSDWGNNVTTHQPEAMGWTTSAYTAKSNNFALSGFNNGVITPTVVTQQCLVVANYGQANAMLGITIVTNPANSGYIMGLAGRVASSTSYIRVDQNTILENNAGTLTVLATHTTAAHPGDRLTALFNGNTITAYVNGVQVSQAISITFNNSQTNFGYIYEPQNNLSGKTQPLRSLVVASRRDKRSRRATVLHAALVYSIQPGKHYGAQQPRATVPVPRRKTARAFVNFKPVTTTNLYRGTVQPVAAQPHQRLAVQRHRGIVGGMMQIGDSVGFTTNKAVGSVQPESTRLQPRRKTARASVLHSQTTTINLRRGTVQPEATLVHQRTKAQIHRALVGNNLMPGDGSNGNDFRVPGKTQRTGLVAQRTTTQRHRAVIGNNAGDAELGTAFHVPGTVQNTGFVSHRIKAQMHRGVVGNQSFTADVEETPTVDRVPGNIQPEGTRMLPRRKSTRSFGQHTISRTTNLRVGQLQPKPISQRALSQRSRGSIKGNVNWEVGPEQPRGPSGTIQPRPPVTQRSPKQRSRAIFTTHYVATKNHAVPGISGGKVAQRMTVQRARAVIKLGPEQPRGPSGTIQPKPVIAQRSAKQRSRAIIRGEYYYEVARGIILANTVVPEL